MVNEYFWKEPFWVGATTTQVVRLLPQPRYSSDFLQKSLTKRVSHSLSLLEEELREKRTYPPVAEVEKYYTALAQSKPVDVMLVLSTETPYSVPPLGVITELGSTHPNNLAVKKALARAHALEKAGKTASVVVVDPPYIAELFPEKNNGKISGRAVAPIKPHSFLYWNSLKRQKVSAARKEHRADVYSKESEREYKPPAWDKETERLRLFALESFLLEKLVGLITEKCREGFYMLIPNSQKRRKKEFKERAISAVEEARKDLDLSCVDIFGKLKNNLGSDTKLASDYSARGICAPQFWRLLDRYLENDFGVEVVEEEKNPRNDFIDSENFAQPCRDGPFMCEFPKEDGCCKNSNYGDRSLANLLQQALGELNRDNANWNMAPFDREYQEKMLAYIREKKIRASSLWTILKDLNKDLDSPLKPLPVPEQKNIQEADGRVSIIAAARDEVEYVLRDLRFWKMPKEIELSANAGKLLHKITEISAPDEYRKALEQSRVVSFIPEEGELKGETLRVRVTPDIMSFCYQDGKKVEIVSGELKTGSTPYMRSLPKWGHWFQVAGQGELMRLYLQSLGKEAGAEKAFVHYMQDIDSHRPWTYRVLIGQDGREKNIRKDFILRAQRYINFKRACLKQPELLLERFEEVQEKDSLLKLAFQPKPEETEENKRKIKKWERARMRLGEYREAVRAYREKFSLPLSS